MIVKRNIDEPESCANCASKIGRLETPYLWEQNIVCESCFEKLSASKVKKKPVEIEYASVAPPTALRVNPVTNQKVVRACPVCGSTKAPVQKAKGSGCVLIILLLLFILPAIIYAIIYSGYVWVCPDCGAMLGDIK